jgi:hypothetical protein
MNDKIIICNGDSWTYGSEIFSPEVFLKYPKKDVWELELLLENDSYRVDRIWPTYLSSELNVRTINISRVADDNNAILNRTINFVLQGLRNKTFTGDNLIIIHGWTTPERREFWYRNPVDTSESFVYRLSPHGIGFPKDTDIYKFWKLYLMNFWNPEEYLVRHMINLITFEHFCKSNGIKFLHFNAFYQGNAAVPGGGVRHISDWTDLDLHDELKKLDNSMLGYTNFFDSKNPGVRQASPFHFSNLWAEIDDIRYYNKNQTSNSFKSFIENSNIDDPITGIHPSPEGHAIWAKELAEYITKHSLL